jgi:hypothetical protein
LWPTSQQAGKQAGLALVDHGYNCIGWVGERATKWIEGFHQQ